MIDHKEAVIRRGASNAQIQTSLILIWCVCVCQVGGRKAGLGAQKVSSQSFSTQQKRAQAVDRLQEEMKSSDTEPQHLR